MDSYQILDNLIIKSNTIFKEFLSAYTVHDLGRNILSSIAPHVVAEVPLGSDISLEPIPILELQQFDHIYPEFLAEVFHGKLVQLWNNTLEDLFCFYLDLHLKGKRTFNELGIKSVRLDFGIMLPFDEQVKLSLSKDFSFDKFSDKQRLINKILNPNKELEEQLFNISKNILIRNCFQHHDGLVTKSTIKELGRSEISVLNKQGSFQTFKEGDKIVISIPELDAFKSSLLKVCQLWRENAN